MREIKGYVDNSVSLENGCAIDENGVTKFRAPKLAFLSEKVGNLVLGKYNTDQEAARSAGIIALPITLAASILCYKCGPEVANVFRTSVDHVNSVADSLFEHMPDVRIFRG